MINPVIYTFHLFGNDFPLRWYGVILMFGFVVGALIVERELRWRGENGDLIWDAAVWVLIPGVIGARLWFVVNATLGGSTLYVQNPVEILKTWNGGLHIFGAFLFGAAGLLYYIRRNNLDIWLFLDAAGPAMLIGQAIGRIANFINQELYGPPTTLPWGIPISLDHRLPQFANLPATTRFHPTFAYEMIWNVIMASFLLWLAHRYGKELKPGTIFAGWLVAAGFGRTWLELFFRPDQPKIPGTIISYSGIVASLMAIFGALFLMVRYRAIDLAFAENWEEDYKISEQMRSQEQSDQEEQEGEKPDEQEEEPVMSAPEGETETPPARKTTARKSKPKVEKTTVKKPPARKATNKTKSQPASKTTGKTSSRTTKKPTTRTKKSE